MVAGVGHIQVALRIGGNAGWGVEAGLQRRAIDAPFTLPGHGFDTAIGQAAADAVVVAGIGEIHAAIGAAQQRIGIGTAGLCRGTVTLTRMAVAGQRLDLVCNGVSHQVAANATAVATATPAAIHCHRAIALRCLPVA
ncbi:hypothetical protein G6F50_016509 [Rhizopus delemar]|uniref:Uncharacterized protein n=1 Tax=Rhizopus delemar TaxID=936053 RepID=A0A9P6XTD7_9FUNG|nr:hypothetical protein G6F50_016509 [Rhizopus delemar]